MNTKMIHTRFLTLFACIFLISGMANAQPTTTISIADVEADFGTSVNVPVTTTGIPSFVVLQLKIAFNPDVMTFTGIANRHASLGGMTVGETDGVVNFSFFTGSSRSIGEGQKLFDLTFNFCPDMGECLAAGGFSELSFFGGAAKNFITDYVDDFIDYVVTTVNGSVFSGAVIYNTLTINTTGNGQVTVDGEPYTEPVPLINGTEATLQAQADPGWRFVEWTGDLTGNNNPETLLINGDKNVTAVFTDEPLPQYTLTLNVVGNGSVTVNGNPYTGPLTVDEGTELTIAASPATGWNFSGWSGHLSGTTSPQTIVMNEDKAVTATFTIKQYTLTIGTTGNGSGSVLVNGDLYTAPLVFNHGDTPTLQAVAADFSNFTSWSGSLTGTTNPVVLTMDGNKTVSAGFILNQYTLTINTTGSGTVSVNGTTYTSQLTFNHGDNPAILAVPATGWHLDAWSGDLTGTVNPQNLLMTSNKTLTASFSINQYTLTLNTEGNGTVQVNGDLYVGPLTFNHGDTPELFAIPEAGHQFNDWSGSLTSTNNPTTLTMDANKTITANFSVIRYTLTLETSGNGSGQLLIDGTPRTGTISIDQGTVLAVEADPGDYSSFSGWTGALSGTTNPNTITMDANKTLGAGFVLDQYTLTINTNGSGTVRVNGSTYTAPITFNHGDTPSIEAIPDTGWELSSWTGDLSGTVNPQNLVMNGNKTVTANFAIKQYTLTIGTTGNGSGSVLVNGNPYTAPLVFNHGDTPSLQAVAADFSNFTGWSGSLTGTTNPVVLTMDGNKSVSAGFTLDQYTLTISTSGSGTVSVNGTSYSSQLTFYHGDNPAIQAVPGTGWHFDNWSGDLTGTVNPQNLVMDGNKTLTANFSINQYTLTINTNGNGAVQVNGDLYTVPLTFNHGDTPELSVQPDVGWQFDNWSGDHTATSNPTTLTMNGNKTVTANLSLIRYTLTLGTSGNGSGQILINGTPRTGIISFDHGTVLSVEADPGDNSSFSGWTGALTGTTNPTTLTMDANKTLGAGFVLDQYTLTINTNGSGTVRVNGSTYTEPITLNHGDTPSIEALPATGWDFSAWTGDMTGTVNPQNLVMDGNKTVAANFSIKQYTLTIGTTGNGSGHVMVNGSPYTEPLVFDHGDTPEVQAVAADFSTFTGWSGSLSGTANPVVLIMDGNKSADAEFTLNQYTLTIDTNGSGIVRVNGSTYTAPITFNHGDSPSIEATPATGWHFDGWSGDMTGTVNPQNLVMDGNKTITAIFFINQYTLTINTNGSGTVQVNGDLYTGPLTFNHGETLLLSAQPDAGWQFDSWAGDHTSTSNPIILSMDGNKTATANFSIIRYTLTLETSGSGTGQILINGTPRTGTISFDHGTVLSVEADPDNNSAFSGWSGALTGTANPTSITMDASKTLQAAFSLKQYTLTINTFGPGVVLVNGIAYTAPLVFTYGDIPTLEASPDEGVAFNGWTGSLTGLANPQNLLMNGNKTVAANFLLNTHFLTVHISGQGNIFSDEQIVTEPLVFEHGQETVLVADPLEGWQFSAWDGDLSGDILTQTLTMDNNKTVTATFTQIQYTLAVDLHGDGKVIVDGEEYTSPMVLNHGDTPSLLATADEGWYFDGWDNDLSGDANPENLLMDGDKTVTARFLEIPPATYTLTVATLGSGSVRINEDTYTEPLPFEELTPIILEAIPDEGWQFEGWSGDISGNDPTATGLMDGDKTVTATFTEIPPAIYTLTIHLDGQGVIVVDGATYAAPIQFEDGILVELEAMATDGWQFEGWSGNISGNDPTATVLMDGDKTVTATFTEIPPITFTLTVALTGEGTIQVNDAPYTEPLVFEEGTMVQLHAQAEDGWYFDGWGIDLSGDGNPINLLMDGDRTVTARFLEIPPVTFTLTLALTGEGAVQVNDEPYTEPLVFEEGTTVQLHAMADEGWYFDGWDNDLSGDGNPANLLMNGNKAVTARFLEIPPATFTLTLAVTGEGAVQVNDEPFTEPLIFEDGTMVQLQAVASDGWQFDGWSGDISGNDPTATVLMDGNKTLTATFTEIPPAIYTLTIHIDGQGVVEADGSTYAVPLQLEEGNLVELQAMATDGWQFDSWSGDISGNDPTATVLMDGNKILTATFTEIPPPTFSVTFVVGTPNSTPIYDAVITINDITYPAGEYLINGLLAGEYNYTVSREGYFNTEGTISITNVNLIEMVIMTLDDTGIGNTEAHQLRAYPNPAKERVIIASNREMTHIQLMSVFGQLVLETSPDDPFHHQLSLNNLPTGMYMLLIHTQGERHTIQLQVMP